MSDRRAQASEALEASRVLVEVGRALQWRGPDPYDGLGARWPRPLVDGRRRRQAVVQVHARAPFDVRRLYGRRDYPVIPKTLGLFASAALRLRAAGIGEKPERTAREALELLVDERTADSRAWGYPWDVQTRWSFYPAHSPNIVVTAFCARALQEGGLAFGEERFRERAREAAQWVLDELYVEDSRHFAYHPLSRTLVHNANVLGARLVHDVLGERDAPAAALETTLAAQAPDGSFPYGEGSLGFVDSFHSGYVLESVCHLNGLHEGVVAALRRGSRHYVENFFLNDGTAKLWPQRRYPEDAHAAGTALTTLVTLAGAGYLDRGLIPRVMRHTLDRMLDDGRAIPRRGPLGRSRNRYLRWCDGPVALGLANAGLEQLGLEMASADAGAEAE